MVNVSSFYYEKYTFTTFPQTLQDEFLAALNVVAEGRKPDSAKPLKGLDTGVFEIMMNYKN